jgi:hypothetical protein
MKNIGLRQVILVSALTEHFDVDQNFVFTASNGIGLRWQPYRTGRDTALGWTARA